MSQTLQTNRLILRIPNADDTIGMLTFLESERANFYGGPMSTQQAWLRFAAYTGQWLLRGYGMFAIRSKATDETIGMAGPYHPEGFPEPEMSWLLTSDRYESKGYATEACAAVLQHLFSDLGWTSVASYIDRANLASQKLAERLGAQIDLNSTAPIDGCDTYRHTAHSDTDGGIEAYA